MNTLKRIATLLLISLVAACGGGNPGTSPFRTGDSTGGATTAAKLVLVLDATSIPNTGAGSIKAVATATSAGGQVVSGAPVTFSVDGNALFAVTGATTGTDGSVGASVSIGADRSNRVVTVTAVSGGLTTTAAFAVTGARLTGVPVPAIVAPNSTGNRVDFRLVDANDAPIAGQAVSIQAGSLGTASGVTGASGDFSYTYTAPAAAGSLDVVANAGGVSNTQTVQIQASGTSTIPPATGTILSASVSANPSVISTNTGSTNNRVEIRALFVGASNAPIRNVRVRFDLAGDANSVGGTFSTGDNTVYSDANGIATTAYIPGTRASPTNGVTVRACFGPNDFTSCATAPSTTSTTITVASDPLAVTIGTNETVDVSNQLTYKRQFVVLVVDASGRAKENVQIVPSVDIERYYKGQLVAGSGAWTYGYVSGGTAVQWPAYECFNEDLDRNGVLEASEDINNNGSLEPRKSDVAVSAVGSTATNSSGTAIVQIEYPRNIGTWAKVKILVSATGVSGTEGRATWTEILPVPASALTNVTAAPAFRISPYGTNIFDAGGIPYPLGTPGGPACSNSPI